jgi:pyridoxine 4-dehydrogenase
MDFGGKAAYSGHIEQSSAIMRTTTLGNTGLQVSAIGFGSMHFSLAGRPPEGRGLHVLHRVLDLGVTFLDTADTYCLDEDDKHHNERFIHKALAAYAGDTSHVIVATKGGCMRPGGEWTINGNPDYLRQTIRDSHAALGGDRPIALWQHHMIDPNYPVEASLAPVREAVRDGLIRFVGVSNYKVEQIKRAQDVVEVVSVQNQYSPWRRWPEHSGVLDYCEQAGLTFIPWSPLGGSSRAKSLNRIEGLATLAREKDISPQRLVVAWLMARSPCILPIPGSSRVTNIEDVLAAVDVTLTAEEVRRIDQATIGAAGGIA